MIMYKLTIIAFFFLFSLVQTQSCGKQDEVKEIFSVDNKVELLFFYKKESSKEARNYFYENTLNKSGEGGHWPRDGVQALFGIDRNGYNGFGITFRQNATQEQREDIKKRIESSPIVYKVYENVVPADINDL